MAEGYTRKIELRVSNQKAYVWDLDGTFQLIIDLGSFKSGKTDSRVKRRLGLIAGRSSYMWCAIRDTTPSLAAKRVLGSPVGASA